MLRLQDNMDKLTWKIIQKIDEDLNVTKTENPEVKQYWYPICIALGYSDGIEYAEKFISE